MPEALVFRLGAGVRCADEDCGTIKSLIVNPADDAVTHLVVEPAHQQGLGKLVPLGLVETAPAGTGEGDVRLSCSLAEFSELDAAEATQFLPGGTGFEDYADPSVSWPAYASAGAMGGPGLPAEPNTDPQAITVDTVPDQLPGEDEVFPGEHVHAKDGDVGHIQGIAAEPGTGRVTCLLVKERHHLLRHRTVLIPRSAVAEVGLDGFHLDLTTEQVRNLPPA